MQSKSHRLHGKGVVNKFLLLLIMPRFRSDRRTRRSRSTGKLDLLAKQPVEQWRDVGPRAHVPGFLLAPDPFGSMTHGTNRFLESLEVQRIELFYADKGGISDLVRFQITDQIVVNFPAAKDNPVDVAGITDQGRPKNRLKGRLREILNPRSGPLVSQQRFGRHDNERLTKISPDLPPQYVKILSGSCEITDLNIVFRAKLEETLQPRT